MDVSLKNTAKARCIEPPLKREGERKEEKEEEEKKNKRVKNGRFTIRHIL